MKIFTFTNKNHNYAEGEYDFVAEQWINALKMAINFEETFNKKTTNNNYTIKLNLSRNSVRVVEIRPGFIDIRGRNFTNRKHC